MLLILVMAIMRMIVIREREIAEPKDGTDMYTYIFLLKSSQIENTKIRNNQQLN